MLSEIYRKYYPVVAGYIRRHGGDEAISKDVFQETILMIYKYTDSGNADNLDDFERFLMGIAKRIWFRHLRSNTIHANFISQADKEELEDHPSEKEMEDEFQNSLIRKHILRLGDECRKVLMLFAEGLSNKEIAERMNYKSEDVVYTKKYKCKEALLNFIKSDPDYKVLDR